MLILLDGKNIEVIVIFYKESCTGVCVMTQSIQDIYSGPDSSSRNSKAGSHGGGRYGVGIDVGG